MTPESSQERQAGVEVTPAMWSAGAAAYIDWSAGAYPYKEGYDRDLPTMIYRAMEEARRSCVE